MKELNALFMQESAALHFAQRARALEADLRRKLDTIV